MSDIIDLKTARIASLPGTGFYIADFITEDEEDVLLTKVSIFFSLIP